MPRTSQSSSKLRDIDQHQAGQDFIGVEAHLQQRRDRAIERAAEHAQQQHQRQRQGVLDSGIRIGTIEPRIAPAMNWPSAPMFQLLER